MSDFKGRNSRFTRGGKTSSGSSASTSRASGRTGATRTGGSSERGSSRSSGGTSKAYAFTRIGSITVPRSVSDDAHDFIMESLRGNRDVRMNVQVYLPKGAESLTLANKDNLVISFGVSDKDKDFVVGHLLLPNNNGGNDSGSNE